MRRADDGGELRRWLIERELELIRDTLTPCGYHHGKAIVPAPVPPTDAEVEQAIRDQSAPLAWPMGHGLRTLLDREPYRLCRRDLPDWHPAFAAGALADVLVLDGDDELIEEQ